MLKHTIKLLLALVAGCAAPAHAAIVSTYTLAYQQFCCGSPSEVNSYSLNGSTGTYYHNGVLSYTEAAPAAKTVRSEIVSTNGVGAESFVNFDITRGTIGAYVASDTGYDGYSATTARAIVALSETLTFTVAGATNATRTPILLTFDWHGVMTGNPHAQFVAGVGETRITATRNGNFFSSQANYIRSDGGDRYQFSILYDLIGTTQSVPVITSMDIFACCGALADFSNTASVRLTLPDTVSFTSASGLFLTATAVPEPAGWAMLILGFGLIGGVSRRQGAAKNRGTIAHRTSDPARRGRAGLHATSLIACLAAATISTGAQAQTSLGANTVAAALSPYTVYNVAPDVDSVTGAPGLFEVGTSSSFSAPGGFRNIQDGRPADGAASSSAYANLATGKIGALATTDLYTYAWASSSYSDRLNLAIAGATADTVTTLRFLFDVTGTFHEDDGINNGSGGDLYFRTDLFYANKPYGSVSTVAVLSESSYDGITRLSIGGYGTGSHDQTAAGRALGLSFDVIGPNPQLVVSAYMRVDARGGVTADFSHTAGVTFQFPDTVTYTSGSGVFLSQAAAVPEPGSWALLMLGFALIGAMLRRSRAAATTSLLISPRYNRTGS